MSAALEAWRTRGAVVVEGWPERRAGLVPATPGRIERLGGYWRAVPGGQEVAAALEARRGAARAPPPRRRTR